MLYLKYYPKARASRLSHFRDMYVFYYNSPAAIARELFKPSTDAASLVGSIKKNFNLG